MRQMQLAMIMIFLNVMSIFVPIVGLMSNGKISCPVDVGDDAVLLANIALEVLYPKGLIHQSLTCLLKALDIASNQKLTLSTPIYKSIQSNIDLLRIVLAPGGGAGKRIYHCMSSAEKYFPHISESITYNNSDYSILVWDDALTQTQCDHIIDLFERSEHYSGNLYSNGELIIDNNHKKADEFDVTKNALYSLEWAEVDRLLLTVVIKYLFLYQEKNVILNSMVNPFGDEGFRIKRYKNDSQDFHDYHIDSNSGPKCSPQRFIAVLIYLNNVAEGGETVFWNQNVIVKPSCGRIVMFPTAYPYVHAGRPPISNSKYNIANFLTS